MPVKNKRVGKPFFFRGGGGGRRLAIIIPIYTLNVGASNRTSPV